MMFKHHGKPRHTLNKSMGERAASFIYDTTLLAWDQGVADVVCLSKLTVLGGLLCVGTEGVCHHVPLQ